MADQEPPESSAPTSNPTAQRRVYRKVLVFAGLAIVLVIAGWRVDLTSRLEGLVPAGLRFGFWETRLFSLERRTILQWYANPARTAAVFTALMTTSSTGQTDRDGIYVVTAGSTRKIGNAGRFRRAWVSGDGAHVAWEEGFLGLGKLNVDGEVVLDRSSWLGPSSEVFQFAPVGKRWMFIGFKGLVVDGKKDPSYEDVIDPRFSPDGNEYAYLGLREDGLVLVVNGNEVGPPRREGGMLRSAMRNGKAVWAHVAGEPGGRRVVFEGHSGEAFDDIRGLLISDDGRHVIYSAKRGGRLFVIRDASVMPLPEGAMAVTDIRISPDGSRFACAFLHESGPTSLVIDGVETRAHQLVPSCEFSPDSRRFACIAIDGLAEADARKVSKRYQERNRNPLEDITGVWRIVVDDKPSEGFAMVSVPEFSPNSRHLAFTAKQGDSWYLIVDGRKSSAFNSIPDTVYAGPECFRALGARRKALRQIEWYYPR